MVRAGSVWVRTRARARRSTPCGGADWSLTDIRSLAKDAAGDDKDGNELVLLIDRALAAAGAERSPRLSR
jgi:hypothetical protein